ncbi:MAG: hypothetical protein RL166_378 [Actinomycetota bacterium]
MLVSALASVGGQFENRLRLPKVKHSVVILVDGLGFENLRDSAGYARFLNQNLEHSIRCEFPSTTATSLAGLATGVRSGKHGLIGYSVYDRGLGAQLNLLTGWASQVSAAEFKTQQTLSELSGDIDVNVIGPAVYESSGFTELTMKGATYIAADLLSDRFTILEKTLRTPNPSVSYLYVPELDQAAHKFGVTSNHWLFLLEELDLIVNRFIAKLPADIGVILTADHGVMDVAQNNHVHLDDFDWYVSEVLNTAGDPRCNFVYLENPTHLTSFIETAQENLGSTAYVCTTQQLVEAGWLVEGFSRVAPDAYIIWKDAQVGYDQRFSKPQHLKMVGQHGGISDTETRVPLIKLGKY